MSDQVLQRVHDPHQNQHWVGHFPDEEDFRQKTHPILLVQHNPQGYLHCECCHAPPVRHIDHREE